MQVEYNPEAGHIRVARPIHGRNGIPNPEGFGFDLVFAENVGKLNRARQERLAAENAE